MDFLDKSEKGFLTGDLTNEIIIIIENNLKILISDIDDDIFKPESMEIVYQNIIDESFNKKYFKLPKFGIKFPELENPRNLFERF